jgi:hypothetical protein
METPKKGVRQGLLRSQFESEMNVKISREYFRRLIRRYGRKRTIRTGGADFDARNFPRVIAERALLGVVAWNSIAVDEKPFVVKKYARNSYWIAKDSQLGAIYRPLYRLLKQAGPIYLISAICVRGLVCFSLSDAPIHTDYFNDFLEGALAFVPQDGLQRFFVIDNASFHGIKRRTARLLGQAHVGISHTAPSSCFLNPIEEHFAQMEAKFQELYDVAVLQYDQYVVPRDRVRKIIIKAVTLLGERDNCAIYARAGLN